MRRSIYLASSWRNERQPALVETLREAGHEVYDFRHPAPGTSGFSWAELGLGCHCCWTPNEFAAALAHPTAQRGYALDYSAMRRADTCVLLLPSGRSAHIEAGWMAGSGRDLFILLDPKENEPELMYKLARGMYWDEAALIERLGRAA
jgi:hypothetical protein